MPRIICVSATALAPLTRDGVLIIGSGHITHNLRDWMAGVRQRGSRAVADGAADPYVIEFREWIADALHTKRSRTLGALA